MATATHDPTAQLIADIIIDHFGRDVERVKAFYNDADPKLHGLHPGVDAVLDAIDDWLIATDWLPRLEPTLKKLAEDGFGDEY